MDERGRALERGAAAGGDEDYLRLLAHRLRVGDLPAAAVHVCAYAASPTARALLGWPARPHNRRNIYPDWLCGCIDPNGWTPSFERWVGALPNLLEGLPDYRGPGGVVPAVSWWLAWLLQELVDVCVDGITFAHANAYCPLNGEPPDIYGRCEPCGTARGLRWAGPWYYEGDEAQRCVEVIREGTDNVVRAVATINTWDRGRLTRGVIGSKRLGGPRVLQVLCRALECEFLGLHGS